MKPQSTVLTEPEIALLRALNTEPAWRTLIEKLRPPPPSPFRPDLDDPQEKRYSMWIYESGIADGANEIIARLMLDDA